MKILITGGAGFIGSAVVRLAISRGHQVVNVDAITYAACSENVAAVANHPNYTFECLDVRHRSSLSDVFNTHQPDCVMHLAAETHVDRSISKPEIFIETNVIGTFNLLGAACDYWSSRGKPDNFRFHHISTDEVFGSLGKTGKFAETTPYDPRSPYSASKASSDHLVRAWYHTYGLPIILTNCSNNYGPYQFPEKLIPFMILRALALEPLPIYGDGRNVRDWLYVEDHAAALMLVLEQGAVGRCYNIGGESERTNLEVVQSICRSLDHLRPREAWSYLNLISFVADRPGHDQRYAIDTSRIRVELGWRPSVNFEDGLEKTVRWYLDNDAWLCAVLARSGLGPCFGHLDK